MAKHHLTDRFVQGIGSHGTPRFRPDAWGRIEIGDARVEGLVLRISKRGLKTWSYIYRPVEPKKGGGYHAGRQQRLTLGPYPQVSLLAARELAMDARERVLAGVDPRNSKSDVMTLGDASGAYVERSLKGRVKDDGRLFELRMRRHVLPRWSERAVSDVTRADVHELLDELKQSGHGTARNVKKDLHALYVWCVDRELVSVNPLYRLRRDDLAARRDVRTPLTDEQVHELWHLPLSITPQLRMLLLTGCRKGEVGLSRWREYDLEARVFTIPPERHKGGRLTLVPLSAAALGIVATLPRGRADDVVFPEGYLRTTLLGTAHRRLTWHLRPHDLRATVATRMAALGTPPNVIQLCLGQSIGGLLPVYNKHAYLDEKRAAFETLGRHILEVVR